MKLVFKAALLLSLIAVTAHPGTVRFAVIGDYGAANTPEKKVRDLVVSWAPQFIITTGDNLYSDGPAANYETHVGRYYGGFVRTGRFFPCLGNHDWDIANAAAYTNYFVLPGNERYYDFVKGPVHFFALDSDPREPHATTNGSVQANWLAGKLSNSVSPWKIVYFHHPPYTSGMIHPDAPSLPMRWPFADWDVHAVLCGHEHNYERILTNGIPYIVNGLGGQNIQPLRPNPTPGSVARYTNDFGAMLIEATETNLLFQFYSVTIGGTLIDAHAIVK